MERAVETFGLLKLADLLYYCVSSVSSRSFLCMILLLCVQLLLLFLLCCGCVPDESQVEGGNAVGLIYPQASRGCACLFCAPLWKARFWICGVCDRRGFKDSTDCEADRLTVARMLSIEQGRKEERGWGRKRRGREAESKTVRDIHSCENGGRDGGIPKSRARGRYKHVRDVLSFR